MHKKYHGKKHRKRGTRGRERTTEAVRKKPEKPAQVATIPNPMHVKGLDSSPVGPVLLERICDSGRKELPVLEVVERYNGAQPFWGCGIKFRWYFGSSCQCPQCFRIYSFTKTDLDEKNVWIVPQN